MTATVPPEILFLASHLLSALPATLPVTPSNLVQILIARYIPEHWYPETPERGSGYRAISHEPGRRDGFLDPVFVTIAREAGWTPRELKKAMCKSAADGWTLFCDPGCVSIRRWSQDLRELWGKLPEGFAASPIPAPAVVRARQMSMGSAPRGAGTASIGWQASPPKSRAVPILAPSTAVRTAGTIKMGVIPPTPVNPREASPPVGAVTPLDEASVSGNNADVSEEESELEEGEEREFKGPLVPLKLVDSRAPREGSPGPLLSPCAMSSPTEASADPFLRPSSRSSSGSEYASDGSLFSAGSASSMSDATTVSPTSPAHSAPAKEVAPPVLAAPFVPRRKPSPLNFVRHHSTPSLYLAAPPPAASPVFPPSARTTSPAPRSVPGSPKKPRDKFHPAPAHGLILKGGPGTVTEHSGGKVGVMGGGVLLGLPKTAAAAAPAAEGDPAAPEKMARRRGGRRARGGGHNATWHGASISSVASFASSSGGSIF